MVDFEFIVWAIGIALIHGIVGKIFDDNFQKWFIFFFLGGPITTVVLLITIWENVSQMKNSQNF